MVREIVEEVAPKEEVIEEEITCMERMIISCDNPVKSYFDVFILLLVGYSCIMSLFNSAFTASENPLIKVWDWIVEGFFYTDLILNFFHAYRDPDTLQPVTNYKLIGEHYL